MCTRTHTYSQCADTHGFKNTSIHIYTQTHTYGNTHTHRDAHTHTYTQMDMGAHIHRHEYMERHTQSRLHADTQHPHMCTHYRHRCKHMHTHTHTYIQQTHIYHRHTNTPLDMGHSHRQTFSDSYVYTDTPVCPCSLGHALAGAGSCLPTHSSVARRPHCWAGLPPPPIHLCGLWPAGWTGARKWGLGKWRHHMEMAPGWGEAG